jgi:uncharacterized protein YbjT (DUF2867 family)
MTRHDHRREQRLPDLYASFNARDVDAVLAATAADVDWPNAWEGGRVYRLCSRARLPDAPVAAESTGVSGPSRSSSAPRAD